MLHAFVKEQLLLNGGLPAIQFETFSALTYEQLDTQSDRIAHYLHNEYHIKQGDIVGVSIMRSADVAILLLSLSKLGAIYVPLDPACPEERLNLIIDDCKPALIITEAGSYAACRSQQFVELPIKSLRAATQEIMDFPCFPQASQQGLIAYIIYTSGTTGKPKGVPIQHSGFHYWAKVLKEKTNLNEKSRVLDFMSIGFDAHIWQVLMAWSTGACLYVVSDATRNDVDELTNFMLRHQITDATLIPSLIRALNLRDNLLKLKHTGLSNVYSTGEACSIEMVYEFDKTGITLWNCYGPTEATFGMSIIQCHEDMLSGGIVPIALPCGDVTAYILDEEQKQVSDGETGELHICSPYLTPGYWNRQEETLQRFIEIEQNGKRIRVYATGDLFSQRNGYLYFHGRSNQLSHVKINGILVNPQETEDCLRQQPNILDACVFVHGQNSLRLVSFIVTLDDHLSHSDLFEQMKKKLVDVAIPVCFFQVKALPKTVNGKIDRDQLSRNLPTYIAAMRSHSFSTPIQQQLSDIWRNLLSIDCFDKNSHFYHIGGDSCKIYHLLQNIRDQFFVKITLNELHNLPILGI